MAITLGVVNQGLKVEIWQLKHYLVHDVFKKVIVEDRNPSKNLQVGTVLRQASIKDGIILIVCIDDRVFQPLVISIPHEALAAL